MQTKPLYAALVAVAFAVPLAATAGDKSTNANTSSTTQSPSTQSAPTTAGNDGGAQAMFKSMDKNGDGFISKEELAGTHGADFAQLDRNGDGKLSRDEHAAAPEFLAARGSNKSSGTSTGDKKTY